MAVITPTFLQTKKYSAAAMRAIALDYPIQNGVTAAGDLMVTQRGAGANMSVDVAAGSFWLKGTSSIRQGFYDLYNDATVNLTIAANGAAAGTYRIDQIIMRVYDSVDGGAAQDIGALEVIAGTASNAAASATAALTARANVGTVPANSVVLADVAVVGGAASIANTAIRDRRGWGRGAFYRGIRSATTTTAAGPSATAYIDSTNLSGRVECSGVPVRVTLQALASHSAANGGVEAGFSVDAAFPTDAGGVLSRNPTPVAGTAYPISFSTVIVPTAGSHVFAAVWGITNAGTGTLAATSATFTVEELIRQNTANNTTTTG